MAEAADLHGSAMKNGTVTLMARIVGANGANLVQAGISAIQYSIYLLDDQDADARTAVTGHTDAGLTVSDVIFDSLQADAIWTVDTTGYNFRHVPDVSTNPAFAIAGRRYLVEYRITPTTGQVILARFRINVI